MIKYILVFAFGGLIGHGIPVKTKENFEVRPVLTAKLGTRNYTSIDKVPSDVALVQGVIINVNASNHGVCVWGAAAKRGDCTINMIKPGYVRDVRIVGEQ